MIQDESKRVLLVGATGRAGNKLAIYLLKETGATVILAGRSRAKLDDLQSGLRQRDLAHRLEVLEIDATNPDSTALDDFDLLVNATAEGPHNARLIQACLDHQADWKVQPGVHLMGLCCDPVQLFEDIGRTDVSITQGTENSR